MSTVSIVSATDTVHTQEGFAALDAKTMVAMFRALFTYGEKQIH